MKNLAVVLALAASTAATKQDALLDLIPQTARGGKWYKHVAAKVDGDIFTNSTVNIFPQMVDHSDENLGTFDQRFYIDHSYCTDATKCPIFMYIGGERLSQSFCATECLTRSPTVL